MAVLQGLRRMGAVISTGEADAYVAAWAAVGHLLGIDPSLLPRTEATAQTWAKRVGERQFRATREGEELNAELLDAVEFPSDPRLRDEPHAILSRRQRLWTRYRCHPQASEAELDAMARGVARRPEARSAPLD